MAVLIWDGKAVGEAEWFAVEHKQPVSRFQIGDRPSFQIHRCETDGGIVTESQESLSRHLGHKLKQPVLLKKKEVLALVEGVL